MARIPARVLAPAALGAFVLVVVIVIVLSGGGSGGRPAASGSGARHSARAHHRRRFYKVRRGQTLSSIAERTGIPIEPVLWETLCALSDKLGVTVPS